MSVINKMLRDLDSRQAAGAMPVQHQEPRTGIARGTLSVHEASSTPSRSVSSRTGLLSVIAVLLLAGGAGAWWMLGGDRSFEGKTLTATPPATVASPVATTMVAALPAPSASASQLQDGREPVVPPSLRTANVEAVTSAAPTAMVAPVTAAKPAGASSSTVSADVPLKMDAQLKGAPTVERVTKPETAAVPRPVPEKLLTERPAVAPSNTPMAATPQSPTRQSPALEALGQAQSLWNAGSHEAALDLLREALAAAERAHLTAPSPGSNALLAALARELARMELAEGRVGQALEMLTRLEPSLTGFADVWAIRGNAAQRLGRHQESASAYLTALKLRPDEPRWMLGAAVSLAAQGNTAGAAELAEKARAGGVLSREVASYLRQLGVPLKDR